MTFNVGEVVYLASGGPAMTVTYASMVEGDVYGVSWFTHSGELRRADFCEACLKASSDLDAADAEPAHPRSIM